LALKGTIRVFACLGVFDTGIDAVSLLKRLDAIGGEPGIPVLEGVNEGDYSPLERLNRTNIGTLS